MIKSAATRFRDSEVITRAREVVDAKIESGVAVSVKEFYEAYGEHTKFIRNKREKRKIQNGM